MRSLGRIMLRACAILGLVICAVTGAVLGKAVAYVLWPSQFFGSHDQLAAAALPTILGLAVGVKTYYWLAGRTTPILHRQCADEGNDGEIREPSADVPGPPA